MGAIIFAIIIIISPFVLMGIFIHYDMYKSCFITIIILIIVLCLMAFADENHKRELIIPNTKYTLLIHGSHSMTHVDNFSSWDACNNARNSIYYGADCIPVK